MIPSSLRDILLMGMSRFIADMAVAHVGKDEEKFAELVELMLHSENPIPQRAAWAISIIAENDPYLLEKYIIKLIDLISSFQHPALTRCVLKYLSENPFPEKKFGLLLDLCYRYLLDLKTPIAVRVYSMQIIYNIACKEPDLKEELKLTIENLYDTGSPGFQNRAGKLLAKL